MEKLIGYIYILIIFLLLSPFLNVYSQVYSFVENDESETWDPIIWQQYLTNPENSSLYNFSYAGYKCGEIEFPSDMVKATITDYGAIANDTIDDTKAIQNAIDYVSSIGGGVVSIPKGKFILNSLGTHADYISIPDKVVLRGHGSDVSGSILYLAQYLNSDYGQAVLQARKNNFVIYPSYKITSVALKGTHILYLENTSGLVSGDVIRLRMYNPTVNEARQDVLSRLLTSPLLPETSWTNYSRYAPFECAFEIEEVISSTSIKLKQPLMQKVLNDYSAKIEKLDFIYGVGIEDLRIESAFRGGYSHHKNWEVDYGWCAIGLENVKDGWINNLVIDNMTCDIAIVNSMNITVKNVAIEGLEGHHGIKTKGSWFCLTQNSTFKTFREHPVGVSGAAHGNVFSKIELEYENGKIDFHGGGFSSNNLFEQINDVYVHGGGAVQNMPHAGQYNVFWNLAGNVYKENKRPENDFFSGFWNYNAQIIANGGELTHHCYQLYPKSIIVGVYNDNELMEVDKSSVDRDDEWIYIEGLNRSEIRIPSLYQSQYDMRLGNTSLRPKVFDSSRNSDFLYSSGQQLFANKTYPNVLISAYNLSGKKVVKKSIELRENEIVDIKLNSGLYIIVLELAGAKEVQKIVVF